MIQTPVQYCDCCGLAVDTWAGEDCPRCSYPISPPKEKRFLASAIRDLQRVAFHGGGNFTVVGLIRRYQTQTTCCTSEQGSACSIVCSTS